MKIVKPQRCTSLEPFYDRLVPSATKDGVFYTVRIPYPFNGPSEWTCDCPSFVYKGSCKHIDLLSTMQVCHWDSALSPEQQTMAQRRDMICPRCGGATVEGT